MNSSLLVFFCILFTSCVLGCTTGSAEIRALLGTLQSTFKLNSPSFAYGKNGYRQHTSAAAAMEDDGEVHRGHFHLTPSDFFFHAF